MATQHDLPNQFAQPLFGEPAGGSANLIGIQTPYFGPTYFPVAYFSGNPVDSTTIPDLPQPISGCDGACYNALIASLKAIGAFDSVIFGDPTSRNVAGADAHPLAIITPKGWEEADDVDPILWVRRLSFTIRIVIRVEENASPFDQLDQLASSVRAQVDLSDLNGQCLSPLTKIRAGRYQSSSQYPEWSIDLDGEFTVLIDPSADPVVV